MPKVMKCGQNTKRSSTQINLEELYGSTAYSVMKKIIILLITLLAANCFAYNFMCKSRNGWSKGNGRYSYQGEWIDYFGVKARKGEYVQFQYPHSKKLYWFPAYNCKEVYNP